MRLKGPSPSFHPPTGVHSSRGSHVYTFTNGAGNLDSSSEEELDVMELRARGGEFQKLNASRDKVSHVVFLERAITEDDSLNKLALQYGCKVADIKRINNFLTEQDMYAVKTIKIPVKIHGIFTEHNEEASAADAPDIVNDKPDDASVSSADNRDIAQYFRDIDQSIEQAAYNQELYSEPFGSGSLQVTSTPRQKDSYLGADWGIRWWNAVLLMLLIGIVLPVFYILYYESAPEKLSHFNNSTYMHRNASMPTKGN